MIKGSNSMLYVWDGDATAYRPLACITSNSLSSTLSLLESATKCNPSGTEYTADRLNESVSVDGEVIDTTSVGGDSAKASWDHLYSLMKDAADNDTKHVFWYDTGVPDLSYYFKGYIGELSHEASATDKITFSATIQVTGNTDTVDPNAAP